MVQEQRGYVNIQDYDTNSQHQLIVENLKNVYDPEISVNIYDLGLIYEISIDKETCNILMSLTSPFCPAADEIVTDVHLAAFSVDGIDDVNVKITFDPEWGPEMMSDDAKLILGIY